MKIACAHVAKWLGAMAAVVLCIVGCNGTAGGKARPVRPAAVAAGAQTGPGAASPAGGTAPSTPPAAAGAAGTTSGQGPSTAGPAAALAASAPAVGVGTLGFQVLSHDLEVTLAPEPHSIEGKDVLRLRLERAGLDRVHFLLHKDLAVESLSLVTAGSAPRPVTFVKLAEDVFEKAEAAASTGTNSSTGSDGGRPFAGHAACYEVRLPEPASPGDCVLVVGYRGALYAPPEAPEKVRFVVGERTLGTIGTEGIYLSPEGGWYPVVPGSLPTFTVAARTPAGWEVVGQDQQVARHEESGKLLTVWSSSIPVDGYTLVSGQYVVSTDEVDGIRLSTYLFDGEKGLASDYLEAAKKFLRFYNGLLSRYAYRQFSIVENFFATGYGMPSYTLLGREVVKRAGRYLGPSGLGHEILHCWWGNHVYLDPRDGNWCEGLTTYLANYYCIEAQRDLAVIQLDLAKAREAAARAPAELARAKEEVEKGRAAIEKAREALAESREDRRHTLTRFATRVPPGGDYPLRNFRGKTTEIDNEVGYSKCSFLFHSVRRQVGDAAFWEGLRRLLRTRGGRPANWADIRGCFEAASGKDLRTLFEAFLDRKGAPEVKLGPVAVVQKSREPERYLVTATLEQAGEPWSLVLPVGVQTAPGVRSTVLELTEASRGLELEVESAPLAVSVDPDFHVFRRLARAEIPPCLSLTASDAHKLLVLPGRPAEGSAATFQRLAERFGGEGGWVVKKEAEVGQAELASASLFVLGGPDESALARRILGAPGFAGPVLRPEGVTFGVHTFDSPGNAFLVSGQSPFGTGHAVTLFWGRSAAAVEKAVRYLPYYVWKGWYAFEDGEKKGEGDLAAAVRPLEYRFPPPPEGAGSPAGGAGAGRGGGEEGVPSEVDGKALLDHVRYLSSPELGGRGLGSAGGKAAAEYVADGFRGSDLKPLGQAGSFLADVEVVTRELGAGCRLARALAPKPGVAGDPPLEFSLGKDFVPLIYAPNARAEGALVFAGYGLSAPEASYDDYAGVDVSGKVVLLVRGSPRAGGAGAPFGAPPRSKLTTEAAKALAAQERRAVAVVVAEGAAESGFPPDDLPAAVWEEYLPAKLRDRLASPEAAKQNWTREYLATSAQSRAAWPGEALRIPVCVVTRAVADALLAPAGLTVAQAQAKIDAGLRPVSVDVPGVTVACDTSVDQRKRRSQNVVGLLEGSDRDLGREYVLLGAHHDHLGQGSEGRYFPGANDNASGVAALLEAARVLGKGPEKPRRSVVFVGFGAEEWGLWGSRAFVESPAVPLKRTIAMLNVDMLARGDARELFVVGVLRNPELFDCVKRVNGKGGMELKGTIEFAFNYGSDHYPFHQARVPALDLTSSLFPGYHTADDTPDRLDAGKLARGTELVVRVIRELASSDVRFPPPKEVEVPYPTRKADKEKGNEKK